MECLTHPGERIEPYIRDYSGGGTGARGVAAGIEFGARGGGGKIAGHRSDFSADDAAAGDAAYGDDVRGDFVFLEAVAGDLFCERGKIQTRGGAADRGDDSYRDRGRGDYQGGGEDAVSRRAARGD